jgi:triosephosphate isomerase (TIM)
MRQVIIAGNWKMYKNPADARPFFETLRALIGCSSQREVVICPPYLDIGAAVAATRESRIQIGAQNLYWEKEGAFTGEVSGPMIKAAGCSHVIVGHSERRQHFGETNQSVLRKTRAALDAGLTPIVCVGERERSGTWKSVLREQFDEGIGPLSTKQFARIVIAYEPLWAIGTGNADTPETSADAHRLIRALATARFGEAADDARILYGGSAKLDNAKSYLEQPEIDGLLLGGASLDPVTFANIVNLDARDTESLAQSQQLERQFLGAARRRRA